MRKWLWGSLAGASLLLLGGGYYTYPMLQIGSGYAAKMACSCHFLQGRSMTDIQQKDLNFSVLGKMSLELDEEKRQVRSSLFGLAPRTAQYIPGRGCVLMADEAKAWPEALPESQAARQPDSLLLPFDSLPPGIDLPALEKAVARAFEPISGGGTRAVVILYQGRLLYEAYAPGFDANTPLLGWSMTKSITNALIGLRIKSGHLALDDRELFPEWQQDERSDIRLRDLLHMNSGLQWNEAYGSTSDATTMLYLQADMAAYAKNRPLESTPDTKWVYSSGTSNQLSAIIRNTFPDENSYLSFIRDSLFQALGMHSALIESDQSGKAVGSSYGWATARDWARFGLLYLQDGYWNGEAFLPKGWVSWSQEVANGSEGIYGAHIWLKTHDATNAPDDVFQFRGFQDQRIVMIPSRECVLVRLGMNDDQTFDLNTFIKEVLDALPAK
ncbi:MAG TPA: serine hydrolase [Saprospiraceae bacterium]|nr:serine hydrolase [Saprospiraceae bacterium]HMQ82852.1 serine hydrolase [Saprospiraceae bacterium]